MISGELAGKALVQALEADQSTVQELALYQRWWIQEFGHDYKRYYQASRHWQSPGETIVKIIEKDPKVQAIGLSLFTDHIMNKDIRWALGRRLVIGIFKSWFGRL